MRKRVTVVGSVCLSVKSHLTSGASVCPESTGTYSAGNGGQTICGFFSETTPLQRSTLLCRKHAYSWPFSTESTHNIYILDLHNFELSNQITESYDPYFP